MEEQSGVQMLMAACESNEFDDQDAGFFFHQMGISEQCMDYRSALLSMPSKGATSKVGTSAGSETLMGAVHYDHVLHQNHGTKVNPTWILLNNQSTVDVFYNLALLHNIRKANRHMDIHCNAGVTSTNLIGDLPGYGEVWFHANGIANILSLARVKEWYQVTYDSMNGNVFEVAKLDGSVRFFKESARSLYYMDTSQRDEQLLVTTVADKCSNYTDRDYSHAVLAHKVHNIIGRPSLHDYLRIIDKNLLPNCPITRANILAVEDIFGPNLGSLKGKMV